MNMKNYSCCNVRKHRYINDSDKYITLDISLMVGSMDKIIITSSDPKYNLLRSGKGLINSLGINSKERAKKYKKSKVCHRKYQYEGPFKNYQGV